jgi:leader peptidase (prepilin peptidase)/N-methyltransferase
MEAAFLIIAGLFGLTVGSFLNVVIWRLPRGESIVSPPSHCPGCEQPIRWFDNVPLLSWVLLRGRCRRCRTAIAIRYPLVELATGALFVLAAWRWGEHLPTTAVVCAALAALLAISVIDWDFKIIPDRISKPGIVLAVALAPVTVLHPAAWIGVSNPVVAAWLHALAGSLAGAAVILAIRFLGTLAFRKEAMGLGDVKLLAFIGALTGPLPVLYALILACLLGAVLGSLRLLWARRRPLGFHLEVAGMGEGLVAEGARIHGDELEIEAPHAAVAGQAVKVRMILPAAGILEDEDAAVKARGTIVGDEVHGTHHRWRVRLEKVRDEDRERLVLFAASLRYVPFGPFLALGGAAVLLFGDGVHWLITEGYPTWAQRLLS